MDVEALFSAGRDAMIAAGVSRTPISSLAKSKPR
jgi:hypothetical protein